MALFRHRALATGYVCVVLVVLADSAANAFLVTIVLIVLGIIIAFVMGKGK